MTLAELEQSALALAKQGEFGADGVAVNAAIVVLAPRNTSAWTRLGRCHLELRQFDDAVAALRTALAINPTDTVATNLLAEVRKRRALAPPSVERAATGFSKREFALLETLPAEEACRKLRPRYEALATAINALPIAERIAATRQKHEQVGSKLFQPGGLHPGKAGYLFAFHDGGRWEPQLSLGWYSAPALPESCMRVGLGFDFSPAARSAAPGADSDVNLDVNRDRLLHSFERFQLTLEASWKSALVQWLSQNRGFLQYGDRPPATDLLPGRAVDWLLECRNPINAAWVFIGRWLFLDRPDDAAILADRAKLVRGVDDTLRSFYPLWLGAYTDSPT